MIKERPNIDYIEQLSAGDHLFKQKLIQIIKSEFPAELQTYESNMRAQQYLQAAENVHKLKHKISILGLVNSYKIAEDYENDLKKGKLGLKCSFSEILVTIADFLDTL